MQLFFIKALISTPLLVIVQSLRTKLFALLRKFQTKDHELRTMSLPLRVSPNIGAVSPLIDGRLLIIGSKLVFESHNIMSLLTY